MVDIRGSFRMIEFSRAATQHQWLNYITNIASHKFGPPAGRPGLATLLFHADKFHLVEQITRLVPKNLEDR
ncbi:MAG: hypothetical protein JSR40_17495 [Proteobacteria bacterium]|nr:hypothetical protein [Pseudomonadota bacterium]